MLEGAAEAVFAFQARGPEFGLEQRLELPLHQRITPPGGDGPQVQVDQQRSVRGFRPVQGFLHDPPQAIELGPRGAVFEEVEQAPLVDGDEPGLVAVEAGELRAGERREEAAEHRVVLDVRLVLRPVVVGLVRELAVHPAAPVPRGQGLDGRPQARGNTAPPSEDRPSCRRPRCP